MPLITKVSYSTIFLNISGVIGPESHGIIPSRSSKVSKGNQLANALDIEVMMPSEAKKLCEVN